MPDDVVRDVSVAFVSQLGSAQHLNHFGRPRRVKDISIVMSTGTAFPARKPGVNLHCLTAFDRFLV
jgi:hypothetical protein